MSGMRVSGEGVAEDEDRTRRSLVCYHVKCKGWEWDVYTFWRTEWMDTMPDIWASPFSQGLSKSQVLDTGKAPYPPPLSTSRLSSFYALSFQHNPTPIHFPQIPRNKYLLLFINIFTTIFFFYHLHSNYHLSWFGHKQWTFFLIAFWHKL
jgi:hypothetical protein